MSIRRYGAAVSALAMMAALAGCATTGGAPPPKPTPQADQKPEPKVEAKPLPPGLDPAKDVDPFPSTYRPLPSGPTAIVGANILTGAGQEIDGGVVVFDGGKVVAVGPDGRGR